MTKEELEKEAEENSFRYTLDKPWACEVERKQIMAHFEKGYLAGAEPREKQIQIDAEQIRALQKHNGELTDKVKELEKENERLKGDLELWESGACRATNIDKCGVVKELEAQIEKMKCCYNCSKWYDGECEESPKSKTFFCADFKCDNWEVADD
jgi:predicted RNase H-like nuclease (RuvC/YqgF family)